MKRQIEIKLIFPLIFLLGYVCSFAQGVATPEKEEPRNPANPHASRGSYIYGGVGWAELASRVYEDWYIGTPRRGVDWRLGYEWIPKRVVGMGALYYGYAGSGSEAIYGSVAKNTLLINYIAPQFVARFCPNASILGLKGSKGIFSLTGSAGLGLGMESQFIRSDDGGHSYRHTKAALGWNVSVKGEFKITERIRLHAMLSYVDSYIMRPKDDPYYIKERIIGGWNLYSISIGVTYSLK